MQLHGSSTWAGGSPLPGGVHKSRSHCGPCCFVALATALRTRDMRHAVAKAGVMNLVRALASEWSPAIRVNGIAPGVIETAFLKGGTGRPEKKTHLDIDRFMHTVPMERLGQPEEIVWPTLFLLGAGAGYITGQTLHVNGGTWMAA